MNLLDFLPALLQRWRSIAACTLVGLIAALTISYMTPPTYQSTARLYVSTHATNTTAELVQGSMFTQKQVKSYADIVSSPLVLEPAAKELGLNLTAGQLASRVSAKVPMDTVLIDVTAKAGTPQESASIGNSVAKSFANVVQDLNRQEGSTVSAVKVSLVKPAIVPSKPSSPDFLGYGLVGLLLGLVLGSLIAILRDRLDATIRSEEDVRDVCDATILGGVMFDKASESSPLVAAENSNSPRTEAYRHIRTNLQFVDAGSRPGVFLVTSSIPSEGKTTTTTNLAITMAQNGMRVCLIDADLRRPRVPEYMGLEGSVGLTTVLVGNARVEDVLQQWGDSDLYVLPAGQTPPNPSELLGSEAMKNLLRDLESDFDVVLVDAPPLLPVTDASILAAVCGGAVVIAGCERVNKHQLQRSFQQLESVDAKVYGVIVNRIPENMVRGNSRYGYGYGYGVYSYGHGYEARPLPAAGRKTSGPKDTILPNGGTGSSKKVTSDIR